MEIKELQTKLEVIAKNLQRMGFTSVAIAEIMEVPFHQVQPWLKRRHFTLMEKQEALRRVCDGECLSTVARELGVTPQALRGWRQKMSEH